MLVDNITYNLPEDRIAKYPPQTRGEAKLLALNKTTAEIAHRTYADLSDYFQEGDVLILNDTKVLKARLNALNTRTGKPIELLLLEKHKDTQAEALNNLYSAIYHGKLKQGDILHIHHKSHSTPIEVKILASAQGIAKLESSQNLYEQTAKIGAVPIPPYLKRASEKLDETRYQTVFAKRDGSVAAPTASLNFTDEVEERLQEKGVIIKYLTLHVGLGTFMPIRTESLENHKMHEEFYMIEPDTVAEIIRARKNGKTVTALGTTVTRALEHAASEIQAIESDEKELQTISAEADIFIYPGYKFKIVGRLVTNFHAPKSTVLMLAAAFAGRENLLNAYTAALENDYRFLSYGDSMIIYAD